ncbi:hypothetical protein Aph01nite_57720 [Acrocarpospora phusangensis]|uniref:Uncharacterized protein n=1 Tax=Acrocarpospora phusangensis TaxID=1070424 RepID=A0A919QJR8_9ACTN|nr:hypothetical protein [Acrocarpospora phusangensis]GIH27462.1 hypothetical protein Aph01nite_57720 [Acrocarpospora phusangensis]
MSETSIRVSRLAATPRPAAARERFHAWPERERECRILPGREVRS